MRLLWILGIIACLYGAGSRMIGGAAPKVSSLTCGMKMDDSCLKVKPSPDDASTVSADPQVREAERLCQAGQGTSCLIASAALEKNDLEESINLASRACEIRTPKACFILGRTLLRANRVRDSLAAFAAGCGQSQGEACLALGDVAGQLGDVQSVTFGYHQSCHVHKHILACRNLSLILQRNGRTEDAIDAALAPCNGGLGESCKPLLVPTANGASSRSLRVAYLARSHRNLQKLMAEDNLARSRHDASTSGNGRQNLIESFRSRSIPGLRALFTEARLLAEAGPAAPDAAVFNPAVSEFNHLLHLYERGLRFEMLFLTSGEREHWAQARDAYGEVNRYFLQQAAASGNGNSQAAARSPAPARTSAVIGPEAGGFERERQDDQRGFQPHKHRRADRRRT